MKEKIWQGADLIFDLDADHLRNAPKSYGEMLVLVKKETQKLLTFLFSDFGFNEKRTQCGLFRGQRLSYPCPGPNGSSVLAAMSAGRW